MSDSLDHARGWFRKADSDLSTVRQLVGGSGPFDTACFHAQQSAEKDLKAFLAYHGQPIPYTHNIEELVRLCAELQPSLELSDHDLAELTPYAVHMRYDFEFWPDRATAEAALKLAEEVRRVVRGAVPPEALP